MRIIRFVSGDGQTHQGIDRGDGTAEVLAGSVFEKGHRIEKTGQRADIARLLAPVMPSNIFCIGLNYRRHAEETGATVGEHPVVFMKPTSAVNHPGEPIALPHCQLQGPEVDFEAELAVVIGKAGRDIPADKALDHVVGYMCANDVSARRWQKHGGGGQWIKGKGFDTFCPLGPCLVTTDQIPDPQALRIRSVVSGQTMQESNTADMVWPVAQLIAHLSRDMTLLPGTVILTGTPEGVGVARNPQRFLEPGDDVMIEIEGIGRLANPVIAAP